MTRQGPRRGLACLATGRGIAGGRDLCLCLDLRRLRSGALTDPAFEQIVEGDLRDGIHRNPDPENRPEWFTLAFFHRPDQLKDEVESAGFDQVQVIAIEGPGSFRDAGRDLDDPTRREALLRAIRRVEREPDLLGASAHFMAVARRN